MLRVKNWITIILFCLIPFYATSQDVVCACSGNYYAIKSSKWKAPDFSGKVDKYVMEESSAIDIDCAGGIDGLITLVDELFNLPKKDFILAEVLAFKNSKQEKAGELRYKLKITSIYYLPISIPFNSQGELLMEKALVDKIKELGKLDYCAAIRLAKITQSFNSEISMESSLSNNLYGKKISAYNVTLKYVEQFDTWAWEIFEFPKNTTNAMRKEGNVAVVDAVSGSILKTGTFGSFIDPSTAN